jgi:nitrogen fixation-related uncharacterized protein
MENFSQRVCLPWVKFLWPLEKKQVDALKGPATRVKTGNSSESLVSDIRALV